MTVVLALTVGEQRRIIGRKVIRGSGYIGITPGPEGVETLYIRSQIVLASRVAGIRPPMDSIFAQLDDLDGLERATRQGKAMGFFGKSALHPRQVPIINSVFTPTEAEVTHAREILVAADAAEARGSGAIRLGEGEFVDIAVVRRAQAMLQLVDRLGPQVMG